MIDEAPKRDLSEDEEIILMILAANGGKMATDDLKAAVMAEKRLRAEGGS